jgi:RHS repeat-associated protein
VDAAGNRTAKTDQRAGVTSNYGYDSIYELTSVLQGTNTTESYTYDAVGNRLSSLGVSPYNYNASNELTSTPSTSYTFDNNGNALTKVVGSNTTTFAWDYENRLTSVTLPGSGGTVSFKYDPFGRRIYKSSSSGTSVFAYDGDNLIEETNSSGAVVARYADTLNIDEPLAMLRSATTSFYEADGLGSVTSLSNGAGALAQTYTFDSFGKQTASSGSLTNPFQYTGRESDAETGLYYYRARYYDPQTGRFINEDPLQFQASTDFYAYLDNDPVARLDPSGLCKVDVRYTPVKRMGTTIGYHATIIVADNTGGNGTPLFYRGQPSGDWWKSDTHLEALSGFDKPDAKLNPDWDPKAPTQEVLNDCSSCEPILKNLDRYVLRLNLSKIPYQAKGTNSNAFVSDALASGFCPDSCRKVKGVFS